MSADQQPKKKLTDEEIEAEVEKAAHQEVDRIKARAGRYEKQRKTIAAHKKAAYASAGTGLVILFSLSQVEPTGLAWTISLAATAVAIPASIVYAVLLELKTMFGKRSYGKHSWLGRLFGRLEGPPIAIAVGAFLYYMAPWAFWAFLGVVGLGVIAFYRELTYLGDEVLMEVADEVEAKLTNETELNPPSHLDG